MRKKILGQAGTSLADQYDIEGSIAGVEILDSEEVKTVHEMGGVMFSERLGGTIIELSSGDIAQNISSSTNLNLGPDMGRILGVQMFALPAARTSRCQVSIADAVLSTDLPLTYWETGDPEKTIDISSGGSLLTSNLLEPTSPPLLPNLAIGADSRNPTPFVIFRFRSSGFGAGTVLIKAVLYFAFASVSGLSSRGLPLPGW